MIVCWNEITSSLKVYVEAYKVAYSSYRFVRFNNIDINIDIDYSMHNTIMDENMYTYTYFITMCSWII